MSEKKNFDLPDSETRILTEEENASFFRHLGSTSPTDHITLTRDGDLKILSLWSGKKIVDIQNGVMGVGIPSDIFFAGTIPLLDCIITVDEQNYFDGYGTLTQCQISIFQDYQERIFLAQESDDICVGVLVPEFFNVESIGIIIPIKIQKGINYMFGNSVGWQKGCKEILEDFISYPHDNNSKYIAMMGAEWISTWYGIQIALLHPTVKEIFNKPQRTTYNIKEAKVKHKSKRKVRYIKRHVLDAARLEKLIHGEGKINRRALIWPVIGHWRTLKSGKKIFIQPYWKGELKEMKKAAEERERIIVEPS